MDVHLKCQLSMWQSLLTSSNNLLKLATRGCTASFISACTAGCRLADAVVAPRYAIYCGLLISSCRSDAANPICVPSFSGPSCPLELGTLRHACCAASCMMRWYHRRELPLYQTPEIHMPAFICLVRSAMSSAAIWPFGHVVKHPIACMLACMPAAAATECVYWALTTLRCHVNERA